MSVKLRRAEQDAGPSFTPHEARSGPAPIASVPASTPAKSADKSLERSIIVRIGSRLRPAINWAATRASRVPLTPLIDDAVFDWAAPLRAHWRDIAQEADAALTMPDRLPRLNEISPDHQRIAADGRWRCFFLYGYGQKITENCARAPRTAALVGRIPQLNSAFFSVLEPGAVIPPHTGVTRGLLTWHLGLRTPRDNAKCWIRVSGETVNWREGEAFLFDDTCRHEVRNDTQDYRIVLLVQITRPMAAPLRWLPDLFLWAIKRTAFVRKVRDNLARVEALAAQMERVS